MLRARSVKSQRQSGSFPDALAHPSPSMRSAGRSGGPNPRPSQGLRQALCGLLPELPSADDGALPWASQANRPP